jgi:hypothetical protein
MTENIPPTTKPTNTDNEKCMQNEELFNIDHQGNITKLFLIQYPDFDWDNYLKCIKADHKMQGIILPIVECNAIPYERRHEVSRNTHEASGVYK